MARSNGRLCFHLRSALSPCSYLADFFGQSAACSGVESLSLSFVERCCLVRQRRISSLLVVSALSHGSGRPRLGPRRTDRRGRTDRAGCPRYDLEAWTRSHLSQRNLARHVSIRDRRGNVGYLSRHEGWQPSAFADVRAHLSADRCCRMAVVRNLVHRLVAHTPRHLGGATDVCAGICPRLRPGNRGAITWLPHCHQAEGLVLCHLRRSDFLASVPPLRRTKSPPASESNLDRSPLDRDLLVARALVAGCHLHRLGSDADDAGGTAIAKRSEPPDVRLCGVENGSVSLTLPRGLAITPARQKSLRSFI